jgi:glycosyltransferase involved in cell wall biosynthesis
MGEPSVSVVICAYTMERLKDVHEAVDSVLAQTLKPHEVIVSIDHNEELFNRLKAELPPEVKVVLNDGAPGISDTRNAGVSLSTGQIVACMDDDGVAEETWLEYLIHPLEDLKVIAVGGQSIPLWLDGKGPKWFPEELYWVVGGTYKGQPMDGNKIRNIWGGNTAIRKEVFEKVGLFRAEVGRLGRIRGIGEEADLCLRIRHEIPGAQILYEYKAITYHKVPSWRINLRYLIQRSYNEGFFKYLVEKLSDKSSSKALSTENSYLRYLLINSIPQRMRFFYKPWTLAQAGAIIISILATGVGYLKGRLGFTG